MPFDRLEDILERGGRVQLGVVEDAPYGLLAEGTGLSLKGDVGRHRFVYTVAGKDVGLRKSESAVPRLRGICVPVSRNKKMPGRTDGPTEPHDASTRLVRQHGKHFHPCPCTERPADENGRETRDVCYWISI
nr:hypothetical protein [Salinibacter altiplanensis]